MLRKEGTVPSIIPKLQALARRLPPKHHRMEDVKESLRRFQTGLQGEQNLDYQLMTLPQKNYHILRNIRLILHGKAFQIDFLILTRFFILITEVKNRSGTILIDEDGQFYQIYNGKKKVMEDALLQVQRQMNAMQRWLVENKYINLRLDWRVVNSNPTTSVINKTPDHNIAERIYNANQFPHHLQELYSSYASQNQPILTETEIQKLKKLITTHNQPLEEDVLKTFNLSKGDLLKGVLCPECKKCMMRWKAGYWHCEACRSRSKDAHVQVIYDYFLLIKPSITNSECCQLLNLESRFIAHNILKSMKLVTRGTKRHRTYHPRKTSRK